MTVDELREAAQGDGQLMLTVPAPRQRPPSRLFGRRGPRVDVICVNARDEAVVRVDKEAVRKWLKNYMQKGGG